MPPDSIADPEGADDSLAHAERHREDRAIADALDVRPHRYGEDEVRIAQQIGGRDGGALPNGDAHDGVAPREHGIAVDRDPDLATDGEGHERFGFGVDTVEAGGMNAQQLAHAVGDPLRDEVQIERLGQEPNQIGQRAHSLSLAGRLAIELGVVDRVGRVRGQRAEELHLLGRGLVARAHADGQAAQDPLAYHERHDADADHAGGARLLDVAGARIVQDIDHRQRRAGRHDGADEPLAHTDTLEVLRRRVGAGDGVERHVLAVLLHEPELGGARAEELDRRVDDAPEDFVRGQRGRERLGQAAERLEPAALLAALGQERGARHHLTDLVCDGFEQGQLVGVEGPRLLRDERHHAPRLAVHRDRERELGPIAAGSHALGDVGRQHA